jgi:hypothetical protein
MSNDEGPDAAPAFVCPKCCAEVLDLGCGRWWCDKCNQLYEGPDVAPAFVCPKCGVEAKNLGGGHRWCDRCCQHYRVAPDPPGLIWCPTTGPPPGGDPSARAWPPALFWAPNPPRLNPVEPPIVTYTTASSAPASAPTQTPPGSLDVAAKLAAPLASLVDLVRAKTPGAANPPEAETHETSTGPPPMTSVASTTNKAPVDAPSEAPAPELTPTEKEIVRGMFLLGAFGPDHPVTKDKIARRSGAGGGVGENIKKLMTSLKRKGVVESSGSGRGPKSGYWLTELGRNLGEALAPPKR